MLLYYCLSIAISYSYGPINFGFAYHLSDSWFWFWFLLSTLCFWQSGAIRLVLRNQEGLLPSLFRKTNARLTNSGDLRYLSGDSWTSFDGKAMNFSRSGGTCLPHLSIARVILLREFPKTPRSRLLPRWFTMPGGKSGKSYCVQAGSIPAKLGLSRWFPKYGLVPFGFDAISVA